MGYAVLGVDAYPGTLGTFRVLTGFAEKLKGLLGTGADAMPVAIMRCSSVHTYGMRYAIDVAFVSECGEVLASMRAVEPRRLVSHASAYCVLERPSSPLPWLHKGDRIYMAAYTSKLAESDAFAA